MQDTSCVDHQLRVSQRVTLEVKAWHSVRTVEEGGGAGGGGSGERVLVFVHPWGILGGSWANTSGLARRCRREGFACVIFNLRGVGNSSGCSTLCSHSEVRDIVSVSEWALKHFGVRSVWLCAQSAGAPATGTAAARLGCSKVEGIILIGYTLGCATSILFGCHYSSLQRFSNPKLFVSGTRDCFTTRATLERATRTKNATCYVIPGAGHFELEFPEWDERMCEIISAFIRDGEQGLRGVDSGGGFVSERKPGLLYGCACCCDGCSKCVTIFCSIILSIVTLVVLWSQHIF